LIELLLVLAVLIAFCAVSVPAMDRWQRGMEVRQAADALRDELLRCRVQAIRDAVTISLTCRSGERTYELETTGGAGEVVSVISKTLPEGIRFGKLKVAATSVGRQRAAATGRIVLRPDGTGTDGVIWIQDQQGDSVSVLIDRLTGDVRSVKGNAT